MCESQRQTEAALKPAKESDVDTDQIAVKPAFVAATQSAVDAWKATDDRQAQIATAKNMSQPEIIAAPEKMIYSDLFDAASQMAKDNEVLVNNPNTGIVNAIYVTVSLQAGRLWHWRCRVGKVVGGSDRDHTTAASRQQAISRDPRTPQRHQAGVVHTPNSRKSINPAQGDGAIYPDLNQTPLRPGMPGHLCDCAAQFDDELNTRTPVRPMSDVRLAMMQGAPLLVAGVIALCGPPQKNRHPTLRRRDASFRAQPDTDTSHMPVPSRLASRSSCFLPSVWARGCSDSPKDHARWNST